MAIVHEPFALPAHSMRPIYTRSYSQPLTKTTSSCGKSTTTTTIPPASIVPTTGTAHKHIWIVAGPSCTGKSTVAQMVAHSMGLPQYIEGDDHHTPASRAKMAAGHPLTDADREPWLAALCKIAETSLLVSTPTSSSHTSQPDHDPNTAAASSSRNNVVITCSALKRRYRDIFRAAAAQVPLLRVHFLFLYAPEEVLVERAGQRPGHFFKGADMVRSQIADLELPGVDEVAATAVHSTGARSLEGEQVEGDAFVIDCRLPVQVVVADALREVQAVLEADAL